MRRERIADRESFDTETKDYIGMKSNDKCCHCGKLKYFKYGATVDHFIPLSKGGTNRHFNLVMLCEDCNKEKGDKIMDLSYLKYLKPYYKKELSKYYDSYIHSFDYITRNKIFACDYYKILLVSPQWHKMTAKKKKQIKPFGQSLIIKSATMEDFQKIADYYDEYLTRTIDTKIANDPHSVNKTHSRDVAEMNVAFWMKFGAIYYLEDGDKNITTMIVCLMRPSRGNEYNIHYPYLLNMYVFNKYSTDKALQIVGNICTELPRFILQEQDLPEIMVKISMLPEDTITLPAFYAIGEADTKNLIYTDAMNGMFYSMLLCISSRDYSETSLLTEKELSKNKEFFNKFTETLDTPECIDYFRQCASDDIAWMLYDIMSPDYIKEKQIFTDEKHQKVNEELLAEMNDIEANLKKEAALGLLQDEKARDYVLGHADAITSNPDKKE